MDGNTTTIGDTLVTYGWSGDTLTATTDGGSTTLFTVQVNATTGAYTATLLNPIDHGDDADEDVLTAALTYTVTDGDGDSTTGSFNLRVDDDTPVAEDDSDTAGAGETVTGNVITGADETADTDDAGEVRIQPGRTALAASRNLSTTA